MQPIQIVEANKVRSDEIARRTIMAIEEMHTSGERISFYSVAKRAQVARSTLYRRSDLRLLVEGVRGGGVVEVCALSGIEPLEEELVDVRRERNELRKALDAMRPIRYRFISLDEVA